MKYSAIKWNHFYYFFFLCVLYFYDWYLFVSEDEQLPPLHSKEQPPSKWDDEDVDENDVKESWEDDDEPAPVCSLLNIIAVRVNHLILQYPLPPHGYTCLPT